MTREQVAEIITYCNEKGITYKTRLAELGIAQWRFYEFKRRYAEEQESDTKSIGEFLQLTTGDGLVPMPSFSPKAGRKSKENKGAKPQMMSVELRMPNGTMMRIQGEMSLQYLQAIIQASSGRV